MVLRGFSVEELTRELRGLLGDPAALAEMGEAARVRAREEFGYDAILARWERVLAGAGPGRGAGA